MRSLDKDGHGRSFLALVVLFVLLGAWFTWAFLGLVKLYVPAESARLQIESEPFPLELSVSGKVVRGYLEVGKKVKKGDLLLELDSAEIARAVAGQEASADRLEEERLGLEAAARASEALHKRQLSILGNEADQVDLRLEEARRLAESGRSILARYEKASAQGLFPEIDVMRARMEVTRLDADVNRLARERDQVRDRIERAEEQRRVARREEAGRLSALTRQKEGALEALDLLELRLEGYRIHATTDGVVGETVTLNPGQWLETGTRFATLLPPGRTRVHAQFNPGQALGRIEKGQRAVLRFPAFPWLRFGSREALVTHVSGEIREGLMEVILNPSDIGSGERIPLTHGLPCTVEIEVDRISPWSLFLRKLGKELDGNAD
ncbi:MAG: biotin/lipoyl-binding protein [Acidobacteriota bacterium]|nr:biotin/lipoyl-binding protein [Acidobacteriota bacterium]